MSNSNISKVDISFLSGKTLYDFSTFNSGELLYAVKEIESGQTTHKLIKAEGSNILWEYTLTEGEGSLGEINDNGDIIIYGNKYAGRYNYNPYVICIDKNGSFKWKKDFIGNGLDLLSNVKVPNSNHTYVSITTESTSLNNSNNYNQNAVLSDRNSNDDNDILILQMNTSTGDILKQYRVGSNKYDQVNQVIIGNGAIVLKGSTFGGDKILVNGENEFSWSSNNYSNEFIFSLDSSNPDSNYIKDHKKLSLDEKLELGFLTSQFNIIDDTGGIKYGFTRYIIESGDNAFRKHRNVFAFVNSEEVKEASSYSNSQISKLYTLEGISEVQEHIYSNIYSSERKIDLIGTDFELKSGAVGTSQPKIAYNKIGDVYILGVSLSGETILLKSENLFKDLGGNSEENLTKNFSKNFREYKFYQRDNGKYEIATQSNFDEITGISTLIFSDKTINLRDDVKGVFDQVTGLNTQSGEMFRLYNAAFARFPDADGLKYWIQQYSSGQNTKRVISQSFLGSAEFKERYGDNVSNAKYVETLYLNVLGRDYDQEGYNYWVGNLNAGTETRYELLLGFSESAENKALFTDMTGFG